MSCIHIIHYKLALTVVYAHSPSHQIREEQTQEGVDVHKRHGDECASKTLTPSCVCCRRRRLGCSNSRLRQKLTTFSSPRTYTPPTFYPKPKNRSLPIPAPPLVHPLLYSTLSTTDPCFLSHTYPQLSLTKPLDTTSYTSTAETPRCRVQVVGCRVWGAGCGVQGVQGVGCRVQG